VPLNTMRRLTGRQRSATANRQLGCVLAFVAGAINAGGFLAIGRYTSHMTGVISSMADNLVLGQGALVLAALAAVGAFVAGAATTALLVNFARRRRLSSEYALPLLFEASLLLLFGVLGARLAAPEGGALALTAALLCYVMGLQNAVVTKLSRAEIRTTHMTGIVTDIGIELGKLLYWNRDPGQPRVAPNRARLSLLAALLGCFLAGGVAGALGFKHVGYLSTVPLAALLCMLAIVPAADDLARSLARLRRRS
jgi:uncharacterized membrane protein YoaK (UPF0700 family)